MSNRFESNKCIISPVLTSELHGSYTDALKMFLQSGIVKCEIFATQHHQQWLAARFKEFLDVTSSAKDNKPFLVTICALARHFNVEEEIVRGVLNQVSDKDILVTDDIFQRDRLYRIAEVVGMLDPDLEKLSRWKDELVEGTHKRNTTSEIIVSVLCDVKCIDGNTKARDFIEKQLDLNKRKNYGEQQDSIIAQGMANTAKADLLFALSATHVDPRFIGESVDAICRAAFYHDLRKCSLRTLLLIDKHNLTLFLSGDSGAASMVMNLATDDKCPIDNGLRVQILSLISDGPTYGRD